MTTSFYSTYKIKGDPYLRLDADRIAFASDRGEDEGRSDFWEDDTGYIRVDATGKKLKCTPGKSIPCGNACVPAMRGGKKIKCSSSKAKTTSIESRQSFAEAVRAKKGLATRAEVSGKRSNNIAQNQVETTPIAKTEKVKRQSKKATASSKKLVEKTEVKSVAEPKSKAKAKTSQNVKSEIKPSPRSTDKPVNKTSTTAKPTIKPEDLIKKGALGDQVGTTKEQHEALAKASDGASYVVNGWSRFSKDPEPYYMRGRTDKEKEQVARYAEDLVREYEQLSSPAKPDASVGKAAKFAKGEKIKSQSEFDRVLDDAFNTMNEEFRLSDTVPVYRLRRALGDRVTRGEFDRYLFKHVQDRDGTTLVEGSVEDNEKSKLIDSVITNAGKLRGYLSRT